MRLSIAKVELQRGLARLQAIVEKRNTMPILANALLSASERQGAGALELAATDLEVGIRGTHPAEVERAGAITASAKKLYEIVRELPDEPVHLEASSDSYLALRCARAEFQLAGTAAEEYPAVPSLTPGRVMQVGAVVLGQMIERTMYAASFDETRYNLNGVYLEYLAESEKLRMVATDGHRLAYVDRALGVGFEGLERGVIIPRKGVTELKRLVDEEDADEVELGFEGNSAVARKGGVTLAMRLIEGEFPNYRQVIPREPGRLLTLDTAVLGQALRRVALLSAERSRAVKFEFTPGTLRLSSNSPDLGAAHEELDVDFEGEPLSLAFNARYLTDVLAVTRAKEVRLVLRDSLSPAQLSPTDDGDTLAVVMPMRL
jgi:DNA polymerase-3 subunit beta